MIISVAEEAKFIFSCIMPSDLRQVTTIEVMEALNSLMRRPKGPERQNIAFGEIAQIVADKRGVDPMVRFPCSILMRCNNRLQHPLSYQQTTLQTFACCVLCGLMY